MRVGAFPAGKDGCVFRVWAPLAKSVSLQVKGRKSLEFSLEPVGQGYWETFAEGVKAGSLYKYSIDGGEPRPDPASQYQPEGIHSWSQVVSSDYDWTEKDWSNPPLSYYIIYELHVGTFTAEGSFDAVISRLDDLLETGINAIELLPVAQFPGERNWGYDGVYPYAVQNSYGGPQGLKKLVDAAHRKGIAVIMDVVYNHLGPEGNYLSCFGPYFTNRYGTPWGKAINFDDTYSAGVRQYFINNALMWLDEFHIDALRLDAVHAIFDFGAYHILRELADTVKQLSTATGKPLYLIAESDLNDSRLVNHPSLGGYGLDSQWSDDFHHSVHTLLTGENKGYYADFGTVENLEKALNEGFVYSGNYSEHRKRAHGNRAAHQSTEAFVISTQNHDQVGNRMMGDRLNTNISFEAAKLEAALLLLSPGVPMIFMGQEYGETAPFQYFVSHEDKQLIDNVRKGRKRDFKSFGWKGTPPDPQSSKTFEMSRLDWKLRRSDPHKTLLELYRHLINIKKQYSAFANGERNNTKAVCIPGTRLVCIKRTGESENVTILVNLSAEVVKLSDNPSQNEMVILDSTAQEWSPKNSRAKPAESGVFPPWAFKVYLDSDKTNP